MFKSKNTQHAPRSTENVPLSKSIHKVFIMTKINNTHIGDQQKIVQHISSSSGGGCVKNVFFLEIQIIYVHLYILDRIIESGVHKQSFIISYHHTYIYIFASCFVRLLCVCVCVNQCVMDEEIIISRKKLEATTIMNDNNVNGDSPSNM